MRFIRYQKGSGQPGWGWMHEGMVGAVDGSIFGEYRRMDANVSVDEVKLLSPVLPSKIICMGRNYVEHAREHNVPIPEYPLIFFKPPSAVIAHGEAIVLPPQSAQVEHEAELVVVIGQRGRWVAPQDAMNLVLGYTIANDVTARDLQLQDGQWTRAKGFDTFCPLGPWIETNLDISDVMVTCRVNGQIRQMASSREMVFTVPQMIAYISSVMTLEPGDIILTGTPSGVSPLNPGDVVEAEVEGIGVLRNPVEATSGRGK